jgi:MFS family permease
LALALGLLVVTNSVQLWMIYGLAIGLGLVAVVDNPTRQSFVIEMVGARHLKNAVTLNSTLVNVARVVGPSIAGVLIATVGIGPCFLINASSYIAVLVALMLMRQSELQPAPRSSKLPGQVRAGLVYVWGEPKLKSTLLMMLVIGALAFEFPVSLPLFATVTMHGNATTYSAMMIATGVGAILGGLYTAGQSAVRETQLVWSAILFGLSLLLVAAMPTYRLALVVLVLVGALSVLFIALGNTTLQLTSQPMMRGRVMALWSIAFLGTTPIGGPIIGYISDHSNPRIGLVLGGLAAVMAGGIGLHSARRSSRQQI